MLDVITAEYIRNHSCKDCKNVMEELTCRSCLNHDKWESGFKISNKRLVILRSVLDKITTDEIEKMLEVNGFPKKTLIAVEVDNKNKVNIYTEYKIQFTYQLLSGVKG